MRTTHHATRSRRPLRESHRLIVLLIVMTLLVINAWPQCVAAGSSDSAPAAAFPRLTGTFQVVNSGTGDQTDPQVDCDLAAYLTVDLYGGAEIHYFDFTTNMDYPVPGTLTDSLPAIHDGRIAFTEAAKSGPQVVIFDTVSQTRSTVPGFEHSSPAIGGNLIVFEDRSFFTEPNESELGVYDLNSGEVTRLTNDILFDKSPAVSPTGNAIVWEKGKTSGFDCNIYSATQTEPGVFSIRALTANAGENRSPSTNGQLVVYTSDREGERDIYVQPIGGGMETRIAIPGDQRHPTISGNLIAFESQVQTATRPEYDVFVYDLSSRILYQVTSTPVDEMLSNISVCNGIGRIAYAVPAWDLDILAFTFRVPSSVPSEINDLIALVASFNLEPGIENSLITKLQDALSAINGSDIATACVSLTSFINECQAQSGKSLSPEQANQLVDSASQIKDDLGCQ